jgi:hypothetical protein
LAPAVKKVLHAAEGSRSIDAEHAKRASLLSQLEKYQADNFKNSNDPIKSEVAYETLSHRSPIALEGQFAVFSSQPHPPSTLSRVEIYRAENDGLFRPIYVHGEGDELRVSELGVR